MPEPPAGLTGALAYRYRLDRELGQSGMIAASGWLR